MTFTHAFVQSAHVLARQSTWTQRSPLSTRRPACSPSISITTATPSTMKLSRRIPLHRPTHAQDNLSRSLSISTSPATTPSSASASPLPAAALAGAEAAPVTASILSQSFTNSSDGNSHRRLQLSSAVATLLRPARTTLAFAARLAKRMRAARTRHQNSLAVARMAATLSLALVSFFVTRSALTVPAGVISASSSTPLLANIAAPTLPFNLNLNLPPALAAVVKPFTESFGVVFLSEFGDKSMFATALMAMKHSPLIVCVGALGALTVMTFIACFLGQLMHYLPATVTHYSSIALFVFFGLQMIMQSRSLPDTPGGVGGERADAEEMVAEASVVKVQSPLSVLAKVSSLIFVAEWCDRSMLATMALAASSNTVAVIGGATLANVVCTGIAVGGAALVASRISERLVALVAGILFEVFAVFTYLEGPEG